MLHNPRQRSAALERIRTMTEQSALTQDSWIAFESKLRTYVRRRVDSASTDDVLGDILLRLIEHQEELEATENPSGWMFRVAANAITDHYRRRSAERRAVARAEAQNTKDVQLVTPTDGSASAELAQCLIPLIRGLPAPYDEALRLTDIEGVTQTAAAKRLGFSISGKKSRVQRGRAKLKQALLGCCEVQVDRRGTVFDYRPRSRGCPNGGC